MIDWAAKLRWAITEDAQGNGQQTDISYVELYLDYVLATGTLVPRNIATTNPANWILDDITVLADGPQPRTLAEQTVIWTKSTKWIHKNRPGSLWGATDILRSNSMSLYGCSFWMRGITPRPRLVMGNNAAEKLHSFFTDANGPVDRTLGRLIELRTKVDRRHPKHLEVPFAEHIPKIRQAKSIFTGG